MDGETRIMEGKAVYRDRHGESHQATWTVVRTHWPNKRNLSRKHIQTLRLTIDGKLFAFYDDGKFQLRPHWWESREFFNFYQALLKLYL